MTIDLNWRLFLETGDENSFAKLYNTHMDDLYSYGISFGFQQEVCKDAIQDIFYKLYISREKLHHVKDITPYLFKSYKYRLIDLNRKNKREEVIDLVHDSAVESFMINVTILDDIIDSEETETIKRKVTTLLNGLTANQREVVYLKYMVGLKHKEIAEIMSIHEDSARKLLYRTMEKLRENVGDKDFAKALGMLFLVLALQGLK